MVLWGRLFFLSGDGSEDKSTKFGSSAVQSFEDRDSEESPELPGQLSSLLYQMLNREITFHKYGNSGDSSMNFDFLGYETSDLVTGGYEESRYTMQCFAVIDIQQDGVNEVVLQGRSGTGNTAYTVLHEDASNGIVVGNMVGEDGTFFKTNGYYGSEHPDGEFLLWNYRFEREDVPEASAYGNGTYYLGNAPVSQKEYETHLHEIGWYDMEDAIFYDYTGDNIRRFAP